MISYEHIYMVTYTGSFSRCIWNQIYVDLLEKRPVDTSKLPFIKKVYTLTNSEKYFFRFLEELSIVKENFYVFPIFLSNYHYILCMDDY